MRLTPARSIVAGLLIAVTIAGYWLGSPPSEPPRPVPPAPVPPGPGAAPAASPPPPAAAAVTDPAAYALAEQLDALRQQLAAGLTPAEAARRLAEAAALLRAAPRTAALAAVVHALDRGTNAVTGLPFKVGPGGDLAAAPSFRVWLLDQLGQLDQAEGALYAGRIYQSRESADEWAIALRNDWRGAVATGGIARVRERALELLQEPTWAKQPTTGFLEAFDVSVATMAWEAVPRLESLLSGDNEALRRAAFIALDRLALETPADFLPALAARPEWLESQPLARAGLFARADLGVPRERQAVEAHLQRADLTPAEATRYFELMPNVNATISHSLATPIRAPSLHDAARLDRAALTAIAEWRTRPAFARWGDAMTTAEVRLREAAASAVRGGFYSP